MTADLAVAGRDGGRRGRLVWVLLALSVALNLFFIGGVFWIKAARDQAMLSPAQRVEFVAKQLSLNPNERSAFDRFVATLRVRMRDLRDLNQPAYRDLWAEFRKPQPDGAKLAKLFEEIADNRRAYQIETSKALTAFLAVLDADQRTAFIDLLRRRHDQRRIPFLFHQLAR